MSVQRVLKTVSVSTDHQIVSVCWVGADDDNQEASYDVSAVAPACEGIVAEEASAADDVEAQHAADFEAQIAADMEAAEAAAEAEMDAADSMS
eukprot:SAG25_NODE_1852_length_2253_cov_16.756267_3_plen_93_part_00